MNVRVGIADGFIRPPGRGPDLMRRLDRMGGRDGAPGE